MRPFTPAKVLTIDAGRGPMPPMELGAYRRARVLVRAHGHPVGCVALDCPDGCLSPEALWEAITSDAALASRLHAQLLRRWLVGDDQKSPASPSWSVVICTRNRTEQLARCLAALQAAWREGGELLVVDNDPSDDRTQRLVAGQPGVRYAREPRRGLNWARARGAREAAGEIVLYTDDDVVPDGGWVAAMVAPFAQPRVAAVTGLTMPLEQETEAQELFERYGGHGRGFVRRVFDDAAIPPPAAGLVGNGANMAFRRAMVTDLGLFDAALDMGTPALTGGDTYAFYRLLDAGYQIVYTPDALVWHQHRRDYAALRQLLYAYNVGAVSMLTRCLLRHGDLEALRVAAEWLRKHHVRQVARALARRPGALPLGMLAAELRGFVTGPWAYRRAAALELSHA